jgi:hypothetical protein
MTVSRKAASVMGALALGYGCALCRRADCWRYHTHKRQIDGEERWACAPCIKNMRYRSDSWSWGGATIDQAIRHFNALVDNGTIP